MKIEVSHTHRFGPARHQGMRLTCLAFAASDLNRMFASAPEALSPEFLYQHAGAITPGWVAGDGLYLAPTLQAVGHPGQPLDIHYPYQPGAPTAVGTPVPPAGAAMYRSPLRPVAPTAKDVVNELRQGHAVGLVVESTLTLFKPVDGVVAFTPDILPDRAHAVLAVGVGESSAGQIHVLVRNSWGVSWGLEGHAWLPEDYINTHALEAFGR